MAFVALEQARAHLVLERLDLGAQRGLSHVEFDGRAAEAQFLGNRDEKLKLAQFHIGNAYNRSKLICIG